MDCNKDEAIRAKEIAEKKMENNDFEGARKIAKKSQNIYPELENITQLLTICDVHCSSQKRVLESEKDWYEILQVERLADELTIKKQYRRLALFLHPDKNRFPGAEAAFKLICEANAVLSDPAKKSLYDSKIRVSVRSAPENPPTHHINTNSQFNNIYRTQNNVSNGFSSLNQQQAARSSSSIRQEGFWTLCPFCSAKHQYQRKFVNRSLHCPKCLKLFTAYEQSAQGVPLGSKWAQHGSQPMPSKLGLNQPASFQGKGVPNLGDFKMGVQNHKGFSASHADLQGNAIRKTVQQEPGIQTGSSSGGVGTESAAKSRRDLKAKETKFYNINSLHGEKDGGTCNGDTITRESGDLKNNGRKRGRKVVESSESFDTSSESDIEDVAIGERFGDTANEMDSGPAGVHFPRRSTRKRQHVIYNESDDEFPFPLKGSQARKVPDDSGKEQKDVLNCEDSIYGNQNSFPTDADYSKSKNKQMGTVNPEGSLQDKGADQDKVKVRGETGGVPGTDADTVEIKSDSDQDSVSDLFDCPEPEFSDFDKDRDESCFTVNQIWACYDKLDGMPRFYAKVKKVSKSPFEQSITWFEAYPKDEADKKWVEEELPVGCGSFKLGKTENTSRRLSFSHQMYCEKGQKRGSCIIYPKEGETWAIFKDWDMSWSSEPENLKFKYEIVEVLSDFVAGSGIKVCYLDKIIGFVSLFHRNSQSETDLFLIGPSELYKFSHRVPCFKMTGSERAGVPKGSFELDPASLPMNPDDLYYPGKAKIERINLDPGVNGSSAESAKKKGKSVIHEGTSTPKEFVGMERIDGEMSKLRRSPRGMNFNRQEGN